VRETGGLHRSVTTSVADWSGWTNFLRSDALDFISLHPYLYSSGCEPVLDIPAMSDAQDVQRLPSLLLYSSASLAGEIQSFYEPYFPARVGKRSMRSRSRMKQISIFERRRNNGRQW
jgi:hypothetical protein